VLAPSLGDRPVEGIAAEDLDALYGSIRRGRGRGGRPLAAATVVRVHGIARVVLEQARRWRWIAHNPARDAWPPSIPKRKSTVPGCDPQEGHWIVSGDGGIFAFGDAAFLGSAGNLHLHGSVVGMVVSTTGRGYALAAADGGVFTFGEEHYSTICREL